MPQQIIIPTETNNKYPFLKKQQKGSINQINNAAVWTKENIMDGFKKFFDERGRYPTAEEIDEDDYLPSSRQIQRSFGGLKKLGLI